MKFAIVMVLLFLLATVWGAQSVFIGIRDRALVEVSCADYVAHPPTGRWVKLVDCEADVGHTVQQFENDKVDAVFVPLRPHGVTSGPAPLVVETDGDPV